MAGKEILTACGVVSIWEIPGWPAGLDASTLLVLPSEWPWAGQAAQVQAPGYWVPASAPGTHVPVPGVHGVSVGSVHGGSLVVN